MPPRSGEPSICWIRLRTSATSLWLTPAPTALGEAPGEAATATRALGLGTTEAVRTGVGIGVLMLRVSVAAAPGTGVASGPSKTEQPELSARIAQANKRLAQVIAQLLGSARMPQLAKRFGFDLSDPLPRNAEFTTDFLQRTLASVVQAETQGDDAALALGQRAEHVVHRVSQQRLRCFFDGRHCLGVLDQVAQLAVLVVADRRREADGVTRRATRLHDTLGGPLELVAHG